MKIAQGYINQDISAAKASSAELTHGLNLSKLRFLTGVTVSNRAN